MIMPTVEYRDLQGNQIGEMELSEKVFGIEPNIHVMYETVKMYLANQRQGTAYVKSRTDLDWTNSKPWRQKGTGRARQGTTKASQWRGGGKVFGPKPKNFGFKVPKKVKRLALRSALSSKLKDNELLIIEKFEVEQPKTKLAYNIFNDLGLKDKKVCLVLSEIPENVYRACRNLPNLYLERASNLNTLEALDCDCLLLTKDAVDVVQEVLG
jgi:large subunit ribosomal protein L4